MCLAVLHGAIRCVTLFVDWGESLDVKDAEGNTYLHLAALSGNLDIFLFLLSRQVNIASKNEQGKTAIEMARIYKQKHILDYVKHHLEE